MDVRTTHYEACGMYKLIAFSWFDFDKTSLEKYKSNKTTPEIVHAWYSFRTTNKFVLKSPRQGRRRRI